MSAGRASPTVAEIDKADCACPICRGLAAVACPLCRRCAPVNRLRRLVTALENGAALAPADIVWLVDGVRRYLAGARAGVSLDAVLSLTPSPGRPAWWKVEDRRRRDAILRELRARYFGDLGTTRAAHCIMQLEERRRRAKRRCMEHGADLLAVVAEMGLPIPRRRRLEDILRSEGNSPPPMNCVLEVTACDDQG